MKKLLIAFFFIVFSFSVSAQLSFPSAGGSSSTVSTFQGGVKGKLYFMLPVIDTLNNKATPYVGALTILPSDTVFKTGIPPIYMSNGLFWGKIAGGSSGPSVDSVTFPVNPPRMCIWSGGIATCYNLNQYYDSTTFNNDSTYYYHWSNGSFVDSVWSPHTHIYEGQAVYFGDSTYNGVRAKIFNAETGYVTPDSMYYVRLNANGTIKDSIQWVGFGVSLGTTDTTIVAIEDQEAFTFPSVPASGGNIIISRNGALVDPIYYSVVGDLITFIGGMDAGDRIRYIRIK